MKTLPGRAVLDHAAGVHDRDPVAEVGQHRQVVADHQQPDVELGDQLLEHVEDLRLHHHVERRRRLVGHDQLRPAGQGHRDHHPLPLPAGDLVGVGPGPGGGQPDLVEQLADPRVDAACPTASGSCSRIGSAIWAPMRCTGLSECSAPWKTIDAPAQRNARRCAPLHGQHVLALEQHLPGHRRRRRLQPQDRSRPAWTCRSRTRRRRRPPRRRPPTARRRVRRARRRRRSR